MRDELRFRKFLMFAELWIVRRLRSAMQRDGSRLQGSLLEREVKRCALEVPRPKQTAGVMRVPARSAYFREDVKMTDIQIDRLINFETAADGTAVRLIIKDSAGETLGIVMTIDTLSSLLMTMPTIASSAVKRAHGDPRVRITYPAEEFQIEEGPDDLRILTIGTPEGFNVSFSLTEELSYELGEAHLSGFGQHPRRH